MAMLSSLLLPFIVLPISFLLAALYLFNRKQPPSTSHLLKIYPIVSTLPHVIKNSDRMLEWSTELLAATPTAGTASVFPFVFTVDPRNVEHITKSNIDNYTRCAFLSAAFHDFLGDGILNVDGDPWKLQRKLASHEFSTGSLRAFALENVRYEIEQRLIPMLTRASRAAEVVDLQDVLERFAFDSVCRFVLGYDPDCLAKGNTDGDRFFRAFDEAIHLSIKRAKLPFSAIWKLKRALDIGSERKLRESVGIINEFVDRFIRSNTETEGHFLSQFAKGVNRSDDVSLRDVLVNFVLAGRDTTPSALTWFFWLLSSNPTAAENIRRELSEIGEPYTLDSVRGMSYLHAAISESIRLYPPGALVARECRSDDVLPDGTAVKKGWMAMYNAYAMARSERIWGGDCGEFRPERWLVDGAFRARNPFEYPGFHAGPRMCLGKDMAFVQMKAVAASILKRFEVEVAEERGKILVSMTIRMEGGLPVRLRERSRGCNATS